MKLIDDILNCKKTSPLTAAQCLNQGVSHPSFLVTLAENKFAVLERKLKNQFLIHIPTSILEEDEGYSLLQNLQSLSPRSGVFESGAMHIVSDLYEGVALKKGAMHVIAIKSTH